MKNNTKTRQEIKEIEKLVLYICYNRKISRDLRINYNQIKNEILDIETNNNYLIGESRIKYVRNGWIFEEYI